jgi:hypothetical protein
MRPISVPELLDVWERGVTTFPFERALSILSIAAPECSYEELCRMPVGGRDKRLFYLREWAFGQKLQVMAACPQCRQQLETVVQTSDLCGDENDNESDVSVEIGDYHLVCRAPNSEDLKACVGSDLAAARQILLRRCVQASSRSDNTKLRELPPEIAAIAELRIAELDPKADVQIDLNCPNCNNRWSEPFDIVSFFWAEIEAWARRLLRQVHTLASAYGWSESEILGLNPTRREIYLAMVLA